MFYIDEEMLKYNDNTTTDTSEKVFRIDFEQALQFLKEDERTVMLLFYMEDQTIDKISKIMNCPAGTIKSHLARGKGKLVKFFGDE